MVNDMDEAGVACYGISQDFGAVTALSFVQDHPHKGGR
jgi:hypothetical protein